MLNKTTTHLFSTLRYCWRILIVKLAEHNLQQLMLELGLEEKQDWVWLSRLIVNLSHHNS